MILGCPRPNFFFWSTKSFASKNQTAPDFFFLWSQLHLGKLHRERAVIGRIFQALPTQTDIVALIYRMFPKASKSLLNTFYEFVPHRFTIVLLTHKKCTI
jgi:hypothetical protein